MRSGCYSLVHFAGVGRAGARCSSSEVGLETFWWSPAFSSSGKSWRVAAAARGVIAIDVAPIWIYYHQSLLESFSCQIQEIFRCMHQLSRLLRPHCFSSSSLRRTCRPIFSTPPCPVHPTKTFATTRVHHRFQAASRKHDQANMVGDMTTFKGKPFDRPSLESLMKVGNIIVSAPRFASY